MPQDHFDRLTAIDASFLHQEGQNSHMHVGAVTIFEGPPPDFEEFLDSLRVRLHLVPRYRQKLGEEQLMRLVSRVFSQQLDRSKPLWETWLVEGLEGNRFALISKTHHALIDGVSGVDLATVLFDVEPNPGKPSEDLQP